MNGLEDRLAELGDLLDVDDSGVVDRVMLRIERTPGAVARGPGGAAAHRWVAGLVAIVVAAALAVVPASRGTIADWFGLDGVSIDRDPDITVPATAPEIDRTIAGPGRTVTTVVDGRTILVSTLDGRLDAATIEKTIGDGSDVIAVDVDGDPGLWIDGRPHELIVRREGDLVVERVAGNTLVWQEGEVIRRLEGFDRLDEALAFAASQRSG